MVFWRRAQKIRPTVIHEDIQSAVRAPLYINYQVDMLMTLLGRRWRSSSQFSL